MLLFKCPVWAGAPNGFGRTQCLWVLLLASREGIHITGSEPYYARICPLWPCYHYHSTLLGRSWPSKVYSIGSRHTSGGLPKRWSTESRNAVLTVMNYAASAPARRGESPATNGTSRVCGWSRRPRMVRMDLAQHASTGGYPRARPCCLLSSSRRMLSSEQRLRD